MCWHQEIPSRAFLFRKPVMMLLASSLHIHCTCHMVSQRLRTELFGNNSIFNTTVPPASKNETARRFIDSLLNIIIVRRRISIEAIVYASSRGNTNICSHRVAQMVVRSRRSALYFTNVSLMTLHHQQQQQQQCTGTTMEQYQEVNTTYHTTKSKESSFSC